MKMSDEIDERRAYNSDNTPSVEHLIRARMEMEYLRKDFEKHEEHDDARFSKITEKMDSALTEITNQKIFNARLMGAGFVAMTLVNIFLQLWLAGSPS